MSSKPVCLYCKIMVGSPCKNQEGANSCPNFKSHQARVQDSRADRRIVLDKKTESDNTDISIQLGITLSSDQRVTIGSHSGGDPNRFTFSYSGRGRGEHMTTVLSTEDFADLTRLFEQMKAYNPKGTKNERRTTRG